jgi:AhpD family alkylhydroperoxidase
MSDATHGPHADHAPRDAGAALAEFRAFRERMNQEILAENNLVVNRFFALDGRAYEAGALDVRTKELLGLVSSLVLRCDDCVTYHLVRCAEEGLNRAEIFEAMSIGLIVGGSIVIPHLRRAVDRWTELERAAGK